MKEWVLLYRPYFSILELIKLLSVFLTKMLNWCCVIKNIALSLLFLLFIFELFHSFEFYLR